MSNYVEALLDHHKGYESPTSFWRWTGYSAISAVLRDNAWLKDGDSKIFPNIYVLLVAGSAQKKGRPVTTAEHLVSLVGNVKVISGRSSIQAILVEVGQTSTDETGKLVKGGSAVFFAPELAAGLVQDEQSIQILTDIYDYKPTGHTTNLIGRSKSKLERLIFSMCGASNEDLLKSVYDSKAIYGGLLGRTFLVKPDEFRKSVSFPKGDEEGFRSLQAKLRDVSNLAGEFVWAADAYEAYDAWYCDFREKARTKEDRAGVIGRLPTGVKKLAFLKAANRLSHEISLQDCEEAIDECVALLPNYNTFVLSSGKSTLAEAGAIVLEELSKGFPVERKMLIRAHWSHFDVKTFDEVIVALDSGGLISIKIAGATVSYVLTDVGRGILGQRSKAVN